jgi:DNA-binding NarL/FixJ family response regulator
MKIAVVDDHDIFRQSLALLLNYKSHHEVIGDFASIEALLAHPWQDTPDCVVLDYHLPEQNSLQALVQIQAKWPGVKVAFLTGTSSVGVLQQLLASQAQGILHKRDDAPNIIALLTRLEGEERVVSLPIMEQIKALDCGFTSKELEVLHFLLLGLTPADIGDQLGVSKRTVEKHKENMMRKAEFHSLAQLLELGHRLEI